METTNGTYGGFGGESLFEVTEDPLSITEYIYSEDDSDGPVNTYGTGSKQVTHDVAAVKGDTRVDFKDGSFHTVRRDKPVAAEVREPIDVTVRSRRRNNNSF